jgi:peptidoglycan/xylan/chitin deacetylase (PgdA/CDA1 family)
MKRFFITIFSLLALISCQKAEPILGVSAERVEYLKENYSKFVALSFDDGPSLTTMQMLDVMERNDARGSFFIIGSRITDKTEAAMHRAVKMGCDVENHSLTHRHMPQFSAEEQREEAARTTALIEKYVGRTPQLFRAPYLDADSVTHAVVPQIFIGGLGPSDWNKEVSVEQRIEGYLKAAEDGVIFLMHDFEGNGATAEALEVILPRLKEQGYGFVTVAELFAVKGVTPQKGIRYDKVE